MADSSSGSDDHETRTDGPHRNVAKGQHDRTRQATGSNSINWLSLDDAPHGYRIFRDMQEECIKVVLKP